MKKLFLFAILISVFKISAQSISMGIEFMPKLNFFEGDKEKQLNDSMVRPHFQVADRIDDTLNFYFLRPISVNSFEVPFYLRYKTKNRWFFDFSFSASKLSIEMRGKANYTPYFYSNWADKDTYIQNAVTNGFASTPEEAELLYDKWVNKQYEVWVIDNRYREEVKTRNFSFNVGYKFLPHKPIKPYVQFGYLYRKTIKNYSFRTFDINSYWVNDEEEISRAIYSFPTTLNTFRFGVGAETYRFRAGINFEVSGTGTGSELKGTTKVANREMYRPYENLYSFGFYVGSDLFNYNFSTKNKILKENTDLTEVPKIKIKSNKHNLGVRINNSISNSIQGYFSEENPLNIMSYTEVADPSNSTIGNSTYYLKIATLRDISLFDYKPQFELFYRRQLGRRFFWESSLGTANMRVDTRTREIKTLLLPTNDTTYATTFDFDYDQTNIYEGTYRKDYTVLSLGQQFGFDFISNDLVKCRVISGFRFNIPIINTLERNTNENVNSSDLLLDFDSWYESQCPRTMASLNSGDAMFFINGNLNFSVYKPADDFVNSLPFDEFQVIPKENVAEEYYNNSTYTQFNSPQQLKTNYFSFRGGVETELNRFSLGVFGESSLGYVDGLVIKNLNTFMLSVGYNLFSK